MNQRRNGPRHPGRRVVELFAGVGGFRIALENTGWHVVWSNQWEPGAGSRFDLGATTQHASECYVRHFGDQGHRCEDIAKVVEQDPKSIPDHDLLVGGFPCQDYSVAKPLNAAHGIEGRKGVLWWQIERILELRTPRFVLLENVDRLLQSPAHNRGRDFAIILSCLRRLGYTVEWRAVNAADYGYPQRRRRVFILARPSMVHDDDPTDVVFRSGIFARALLVRQDIHQESLQLEEPISDDPFDVSEHWKRGAFPNAGFMAPDGKYSRASVIAKLPSPSKRKTLIDVLEDRGSRKRRLPIHESFFLDPAKVGDEPDPRQGTWRYLKNAKAEPREKVVGGIKITYQYKEGRVGFPDPLDAPSRTILTSEGGSSASRSRHVVEAPDGRLRRLIPEELERLNGFPSGWTQGMRDNQRAFMMGNALVVPLVARIGRTLNEAADDDSLWRD